MLQLHIGKCCSHQPRESAGVLSLPADSTSVHHTAIAVFPTDRSILRRQTETSLRNAIKPAMEFPSVRVLAAFGQPSDSDVQLLLGGQGKTFRCGSIVLKKNTDAIEASWSAHIFHHLAPTQHQSFRIPAPIVATNDQFVFEGWTASEFVAGVQGPTGKWACLLEISHHFHTALKDIPCPKFLGQRQHIWAIADRVAWGEADITVTPSLQKVYNQLIALRRDVQCVSQIVHGDMTGNVLFSDDGLPPTIIDFSPFYRPVEYSNAIIITDAILDYGQGKDVIQLVGMGSQQTQMLVRAVIFRLVAWSQYIGPQAEVTEEYVKAFERAVLLVSTLCSKESHIAASIE